MVCVCVEEEQAEEREEVEEDVIQHEVFWGGRGGRGGRGGGGGGRVLKQTRV